MRSCHGRRESDGHALTAGLLATYAGTHAALWTVCTAALLPPLYLLAVPVGRRRDFA